MFKGGWSVVPVLVAGAAVCLAAGAFMLARDIVTARAGVAAAPAGPIALTYGLFAEQQLARIGAAPPAEQTRRAALAIRALEQSARIAPASPNTWMRLAYAAQYASDRPGPLIDRYLARSYQTGPLIAAAAPIRTALALVYWDQLAEANHAAARYEVRVICDKLAKEGPCRDIRDQVSGLTSPTLVERAKSFEGLLPSK